MMRVCSKIIKISANLDEIIAGKKPGRTSEHERVFSGPIGMAHEDIAVASAVYEEAIRKGIGLEAQFLEETPLGFTMQFLLV